MKINHLVDFVFQDGTISMHVTAVEYQYETRPPAYAISSHNTMRQELHHVSRPATKEMCISLATAKRREMHQDIASIWKDLNK